jgi:SAM-dependent methyltransferase
VPTLTTHEAKAFYDKFGAKQDRQAFYEQPALDQLVAHASFDSALEVFEFGCGTGRFALDLLQRHLPATATYRGTDISGTMLELARARLAPMGKRASVIPSSGGIAFAVEDHSIDRVVSTYVIDLLPHESVRPFLAEARRALRPGGLLCLVGITHGTTVLSRIVMGSWQWLFTRKPSWVGGCRPTLLAAALPPAEWNLRFHTVVVAWGIASEIVVASLASAEERPPRPSSAPRAAVRP